jgi:uncharacterized OB-fold protein
MSEKPTIEQYKKNIEEGHFKAYKCVDCGAVRGLPTGTCYSCGGSNMTWTPVSGRGTLVSFTVIHVAPDEFQEEAPYYVGIVQLEEGTRVTTRLGGMNPEKPEMAKIGAQLKLGYEKGKSGHTYLCFSPV